MYGESVDFRAPEIIPVPREMTYMANVAVRLDTNAVFEVVCPDAAASAWVADHAEKWFGVRPRVSQTAAAAAVDGDEGYLLEAAPGRIVLGGRTLRGVKYALLTLRQVAERESRGSRLAGYWLLALKIKDSPALAFRGVHFCWFPECSAKFIEHQIRLAAYYKFNYAVIENWGVFKSVKHPYLAVPNAPLNAAEARRLTAIAADLGLTLVPQINIYGHAALLRAMGGKHATLDYHPEYQPIFEPAGGWNWCLSNPEATQVVKDMVAEMHEAFGNPPFFHIGCDEADPPTCPTCRAVKPYAQLVTAHIQAVAEMLRSRGARAMMWHDMLLEKNDPRWKGFYANGNADEAKMLDALPKDIVICDWYYGSDGGGSDPTGGKVKTGKYPTLDYFTARGFDTLTCPWRVEKGIVAQMKYAREKKLFGVLETVWHHYRGREFATMMEASACGAWGGERVNYGRRGSPFATHWRQCGWDMGLVDYVETGYYDHQVNRDAER